jgi:uncharacterized membrane-anchored protein YhcB (DUF1043 family)
LQIIKYLIINFLITIFILCISYVFYTYTPNLSILNLVARFTEISNHYNTSDSIVKLLNEKNNEISTFIDLIKLSLSIILGFILLVFQFLVYKQNSFQNDINMLKNETNKRMKELYDKFSNIDSVLLEHFDDYSILIRYTNGDNRIHRNMIEALKYDIDKISDLQKGDVYKSTVIFKKDYVEEIDNMKYLSDYINILKEKALKNITIKRVFILERELTHAETNYLQIQKNHKIDIKTINNSEVNSIKKMMNLRQMLSNNFVIINDKEVGFAYPLEGEPRFAINIINTNKELTNDSKSYMDFFDDIYKQARVFKG